MDRFVIRESINFFVLAIFMLILVVIIGVGTLVVYVQDFQTEVRDLRTSIASGDWTEADKQMAELKAHGFLKKQTLHIEFEYLQAKYAGSQSIYEKIQGLRLANYIFEHYPKGYDGIQAIIGNLYYDLGKGYYEQAWVFLHEGMEQTPPTSLAEELVLYKKFYTIASTLDYHEDATRVLEKIVLLEPTNPSHYLELAERYLRTKYYDEATRLFEDVLFSEVSTKTLPQEQNKGLVDQHKTEHEQLYEKMGNSAAQRGSFAVQKAGMMLYAWHVYLGLDERATFYKQYATAKVTLQMTAEDNGGDLEIGQKRLRRNLENLFDQIDGSTFEGNLESLYKIFEQIDDMSIDTVLIA